MHIEKRNQKMLMTVTMIVLVAIVLIITAGFLIQGQIEPFRDRDMGRSTSPIIHVESAQTSPTGELAISTGIVLLIVAFGVIVTMLWVGRNRVRTKST